VREIGGDSRNVPFLVAGGDDRRCCRIINLQFARAHLTGRRNLAGSRHLSAA
jgi:hypothetical protein